MTASVQFEQKVHTMKLYYGVGACSLAVLITAIEADIAIDLEKVDIYHLPHTLPDGSDFASVNPRHYVPVLDLGDGTMMSEVATLVQYVADLAPDTGLGPGKLSPDRYELQSWLTFISSELHKAFSPWLFHAEVGAAAQDFARSRIAARLDYVEAALTGRDYLMGRFTVADAYLFTILGWAKFTRVPLEAFPNIRAWLERVGSRPAVIEALRRHV